MKDGGRNDSRTGWEAGARGLALMCCVVWVGCALPIEVDMNGVVSDASVSAAVEIKLAEDKLFDLTGITVTTEAGVVTLMGTVTAAEQKARAADLARQVKGVKRVRNDLEIRGGSD